MYQQAIVRPTVNFDRLEIVLVITNFKPKPGQPDELDAGGLREDGHEQADPRAASALTICRAYLPSCWCLCWR